MYDVVTNKEKGNRMTDKKYVRTLSREKLEALVYQSHLSELAKAEIKRREKKRERKILSRAA